MNHIGLTGRALAAATGAVAVLAMLVEAVACSGRTKLAPAAGSDRRDR